MGCGSSQTSTTSQANPAVTAGYTSALNQAQGVAQQPLEQYSGSLVSGFSPDQLSAMGTVDASQGISNPYINQAGNYFQSAATPITPMNYDASTINSFMSPYLTNVANATQQQINQGNAVQQQQLQGNAAAQGAYGGDRMAVAQSLLANQQNLSEAPTIANIYNTGYTGAQGEFNAQQQAQIGAQEASGWLQQGGAYGIANLGQEAQSTALTGANAQLGTGTLQQQLSQENLNIPYEEFQSQQAFPYQTTGWLANVAEGLGSGLGGTSTTTSPGPSAISQVAGLGTAGLGVAGLGNSTNWFGLGSSPGGDGTAAAAVDGGESGADIANRGGRIERAAGGPLNLGAMPVNTGVPNVSINVIPTMGGSGGGAGNAALSPMMPTVTQTQSSDPGILGGLSQLVGLGNLATKVPGVTDALAALFAAHAGGRVGRAGGGGTASPGPMSNGTATAIGLPPASGNVASSANASAFPSINATTTGGLLQWQPTQVSPNAGVTLPVHSAVPNATLGGSPPSSAGPLSLAQIQPTTNYAPTFDQTGYPLGMTATAPGTLAGAPATLPTSNGVIQRGQPAPAAANTNASTDNSLNAQYNTGTPNPYAPPGTEDYALYQSESGGGGGGGGNRGGRITRDTGGGTTTLPAPALSLGTSVPDTLISMGYIPKYQGSGGHGGVGIPQAPRPAAQTQQQDLSSLGTTASSLGKLFSKSNTANDNTSGGDGESQGGAVYPGDMRQGYDAGGTANLSSTAQYGSGQSGGMGSPVQNLIQQYLALPMEQLQELAARAGGTNSSQAQAIQQALRIKRMNPASSSANSTQQQQATLGSTPYSALSPSIAGFGGGPGSTALSGGSMARGGRLGLADGGGPDYSDPSTPPMPDQPLIITPLRNPDSNLGASAAVPQHGAEATAKAPSLADVAPPPKADVDLAGQTPNALRPSVAPPAAAAASSPARIGLSGSGPNAQLVDQDTGKPLDASAQKGVSPLADYIRQGAIARGLDPSKAVHTANTEGGTAGFQLGDSGSSGGSFQLHLDDPAHPGKGTSLGDQFYRDTGKNPLDEKNHLATIDYALDYAAAHGHDFDPNVWHGLRGSGGTGSSGASGSATTGLGQTPSSGASATAGSAGAKIDGMLAQLQRQPPQQQKQTLANNPWLALIAAGLGMMASRSPFPGVGIGEGGLAGVKVLQEQGAQQAKEDTANNESNNRNSMLQATLLSHQQTAEHEAAVLTLEAARLKQQGDLQGGELLDRQAQRNLAAAREVREAQDAKDRLAFDKQKAEDDLSVRRELAQQGRYQWQPYSRPDPNNPGQTESGMVRLPTRGDEEPQYQPGVSLTGHNAFQSMQQAYLAVHPGDSQGALDYAAKRNGFRDGVAFANAVSNKERILSNQWSNDVTNAGKPPPDFHARAIDEAVRDQQAGQAASVAATPGPASAATPAAKTPTAAVPVIPPRPPAVPEGSQYNVGRQMWRDPHGRVYDAHGNLIPAP